jgi:preprotein translocase subunit SecB
MTDDNKVTKDNENIGEVQASPLIIHRQYLKDLSFENPNAPQIFNHSGERPAIDININIDVSRSEHPEHKDYYEVLLTLDANSTRKGDALFIAQIVYGAAVSVQHIDEPKHHPLLFVEVPHLIYPYARQILAHVTQSGAFMPLQLAPVDFRQMYLARFAKEKPEIE